MSHFNLNLLPQANYLLYFFLISVEMHPAPNHARLNHLQIKEQEALNRQRQQQDAFEAEQKAALIRRQREKYSHVTSHVSQPQDDVEIKVFVRECEPGAQMYQVKESTVAKPATQVQQQQNTQRVSTQNQNPGSAAKRGEVPHYLLKRKAEMEAEKEKIAQQLETERELAKYPPGHRPLEESERQEILQKLAQRKSQLQLDLGRLPMRYDTQAIKSRKNQLEAEMAEVEAAERKFSVKKQLFVPI